jgi:hypothetical protein
MMKPRTIKRVKKAKGKSKTRVAAAAKKPAVKRTARSSRK